MGCKKELSWRVTRAAFTFICDDKRNKTYANRTWDLLAKKGRAARLQKMPETGISTLYAINSGRMPRAAYLMKIPSLLRYISST